MIVSAVLSLRFRIAALLVFAAVVAQTANAAAETLTVRVAGLHGTAGNLHVMVWNEAPGFPMQPEKAVVRRVIAVAGPHMEVSFPGLSKGVYAVAAYQDQNSNGKLDRSVMGWPTEPVGASNGATGIMGPPKFKDAAFALKQAAQIIDLALK